MGSGEVKKLATREKWLAARRHGIGGSDAPAILRVSPYRSPMQVYVEKLGLDETEQTNVMKWGKRLESVVAEAYAEETKRKVIDLGEYTITVHGVIPILIATIDRLVEDPVKGPGVLQIKTTSWKSDDWDDDGPLDAQVQLQHEMNVANVKWGSLAVLLFGRELRWLDYDIHAGFVDEMVKKETEFWARVQAQEPPEADWLEATSQAIKVLYPKDSGETIALPPEAVEWAIELEEAKRQIKQFKQKEDAAGNAIRAALGHATFGVLPDGTKYQWKWGKRKGYKVEDTETRTLRRLK